MSKFGPGLPRLLSAWSLDSRRMPQVNNPQVRRDMELSPVGPGTVFSRLAQMSKNTRERVKLINKTEQSRLQRIEKLIEKEHRFKNNLQSKAIDRTTKTLKEKQALIKILGGEYRVDNFVTMKPGFDSNQIETPDIARRYVMESRIFNSGFNVKSLRPEVHRQLRKLDPNHKYKSFKKKLLANYKEHNVEINRVMTDGTFYDMLQDRDHWREYNDPRRRASRRHIYSETDIDRLRKLKVSEDRLPEVTQAVREEKAETGMDVKEEKEADECQKGAAREKSVVLERRLPRRPQAGFSMTMRTLGPVYFQASVNTAANPEVPSVEA